MTGESTLSLAISFGVIALAAWALYPRGRDDGTGPPTVVVATAPPEGSAESTGPRPAAPTSRPIAPFTTVAPGEDLAAVARRIYGTDEVLRPFWKANRDQVETPDEPIAPGTLLRTPSF